MCEPPFVLHGGEIIKAGVATIGVVPALDVLEDRHAGFNLVSERETVKELAFEGGKEALAHGVVVAIPHGTHGGAHPGLFATFSEGHRGVL